MAQDASPPGLHADIGLTFTGRLTISHDLVPALGPGGADPDGLPAEITVDVDSGQCTVSLFGDYSVHDVLGGHVADLRALFRQTAVTG